MLLGSNIYFEPFWTAIGRKLFFECGTISTVKHVLFIAQFVSVLFDALILPLLFGIDFVAVGRLVPLPALQSLERIELVGVRETASM